MSPFKTFAVAALAMISVPLAACSEEAAPLSPEATQQMEQVVRDYLIKNPEVIIEALDAYQAREQQAVENRQTETLGLLEQDIKRNPNDPVMGNPDGKLTVVEFFDYRCGYCKRVFDDVQALVKEAGDIRYVLKEFPILGPDSVFASRAAQAVWIHQKDKYAPFHSAMMKSKGNLNEAKVLKLAGGVGIDITRLKDQMDDPVVAQTLEATARQAQALNITGTPAFLFGSKIVPGAIPLDQMQALVGAMRKHP